MKKAITNPGDIFQAGRHRFACGNCNDAALVARLHAKDSTSLIVSDPPYAAAYVEGKADFTKTKKTHLPIANDHLQTDDQYRAFTRSWLEAVRPHLARKNAIKTSSCD